MAMGFKPQRPSALSGLIALKLRSSEEVNKQRSFEGQALYIKNILALPQLRIPNQIGHPFRRKLATCSEANRPGLRSKSATPLGIG
jgi:hypothetical protein